MFLNTRKMRLLKMIAYLESGVSVSFLQKISNFVKIIKQILRVKQWIEYQR